MPLIALCQELPKDNTEWVQILPSGPQIKGLDGRTFSLSNPELIVEAFNERGLPLVVDYEHGSEDGEGPDEQVAAGWIEELEVRDDGVWAKVEWTEKAQNHISSKEYRFISPAFLHTVSGEIKRFSSVGLTNKPNLVMTALNSEEAENGRNWDELSLALGSDVNSPESALKALNRVKLNQQNAENEKLVSSAMQKGAFPPSQREFMLTACNSQGAEKFSAFIAAMGKPFAHLKKPIKQSTASKSPHSKLTPLQKAVCRQVDVSEELFLSTNKED
ncbi:hypothetical protein F9L16_23980 [Agarivorans sp. B2Z047]|uniref:phage protease n=1 Tax=Agarivorans sp. B2Z047 TaxID=2652721 RepID=UPI00128E1226|nr:phage protease [Agarivorans sp. B2Z047]MPW32007.1 hypothetical protein [Agarivorans sp. B2Z047]UQN40657.1 phage protease [Agarivorans sp. B2Z047]UQN41873.1 phage protease [Agarivorans sp. B2Z047]